MEGWLRSVLAKLAAQTIRRTFESLAAIRACQLKRTDLKVFQVVAVAGFDTVFIIVLHKRCIPCADLWLLCVAGAVFAEG